MDKGDRVIMSRFNSRGCARDEPRLRGTVKSAGTGSYVCVLWDGCGEESVPVYLLRKLVKKRVLRHATP
jgi:hypothetical protein